MKNNILILIFVLVSLPAFSQNIYFSEPTCSHVDIIWITGQGPIAYNMYAANGWVIDWYKAKLTYPNGSESDWQNGETGGWWVTKAGTYGIEGKAYGNYVLGGSLTLYREKFNFEVVDNYAPAIPQNLSVGWSGNHPLITWSANTEYDMDSYKIQKMIVGETGYTTVATVSKSTTQWVDENVSPAGKFDPTYSLKYRIRANDINGNSSDLSVV